MRGLLYTDRSPGFASHLRPTACASERLSWDGSDQPVRYTLPKPLPSGQTALTPAPLELLDRLAALIPPPRRRPTRWRAVAQGIGDEVERTFVLVPCPLIRRYFQCLRMEGTSKKGGATATPPSARISAAVVRSDLRQRMPVNYSRLVAAPAVVNPKKARLETLVIRFLRQNMIAVAVEREAIALRAGASRCQRAA